jgi:hypothetical protein
MIDNDSRISPRYTLLVPGWIKWFVGVCVMVVLVFTTGVSVIVLIDGQITGLVTLAVAGVVLSFSWGLLRAFRDPKASYVELTEDGLLVSPIGLLSPGLAVRFGEIYSVHDTPGCLRPLFHYPYPAPGPHIDVELKGARWITGGRAFRRVKLVHLKLDEPERFLSEITPRTDAPRD